MAKRDAQLELPRTSGWGGRRPGAGRPPITGRPRPVAHPASGPVWADRYRTRALETPEQVRKGIVYVLMNFRKHRPSDRRAFDTCSSAPWFDGLRPAPRPPAGEPPVRAPRTWLASVGWRRHGLVRRGEAPSDCP